MTFLSRLLGKQSPKLLPGERAYADDDFEGHTFCVRAKTADDEGLGRTIRTGFTTNAGAVAYADWCNGAGKLEYPTGAV